MSTDLIAKAKTSIHANKNKVWAALITPDAIQHYMFGAQVESEPFQPIVG